MGTIRFNATRSEIQRSFFVTAKDAMLFITRWFSFAFLNFYKSENVLPWCFFMILSLQCWAIIGLTDEWITVAFRGTQTKVQLIAELLESMTEPKHKVLKVVFFKKFHFPDSSRRFGATLFLRSARLHLGPNEQNNEETQICWFLYKENLKNQEIYGLLYFYPKLPLPSRTFYLFRKNNQRKRKKIKSTRE